MSDMEISELEGEVIQTATAFHCRQEDREAELVFHDSVSSLIEARFQSLKSDEGGTGVIETSKTRQLIRLGESYASCWQLTPEEIERLAVEADTQLCTMNGDTGTVEVTVKQLAQLLAAARRNLPTECLSQQQPRKA